jgi:hypothetical protein
MQARPESAGGERQALNVQGSKILTPNRKELCLVGVSIYNLVRGLLMTMAKFKR